MKLNRKIARNYAQALIEVVKNNLSKQDLFLQEIKVINELMSKDKGVKKFITNPGISKEEKKKFVETFRSNISTEVMNFLYLLIDKNRFSLLPEIQNEMNSFINKAKGIVIAEITSAYELDLSTVNKIVETLRRSVSTTNGTKDIKIEQKIDLSLLGGLKVRINDLVYDGSIKGRLENLKRRLG